MKPHKHTIPLAALLLAGTAHAAETSQSYGYTLNGTVFTNDSFTMDSFDTMGGTRTLTDIRINLDADFTIDYDAENLESFAITADQWFFEPHVATTLEIAGLATGGIWNATFGQLSADLAAADGVEGSGPDYTTWSFGGPISRELFFQDFVFPAFETSGPGTIDGTLGVFTDLAITPPPPMFSAGATGHLQNGTFTLTYIYSEVPAPGGAAVLVLGLLGAARRTR